MENETLAYVLVRTGRIIGRETLIGSSDDPERLADNADALAPLHPGQTFTVRGPQGEALYTVVGAAKPAEANTTPPANGDN